MKASLIGLSILLAHPLVLSAQTDVSLYFKNNETEQKVFVESKSGNLFNKLGHHGPAIENQWFGLRLYFDKKAAIDVYSKEKQQMELKEKKWYPTKNEQRSGWGSDYYKVGKTVGLGGVKLWDNGRIINLHPVTTRTAKVENAAGHASMVMVSEGVPYKGGEVDISVKVTVFDSNRKALVEAKVLEGEEVQFVTGINFFSTLEVVQTEGYIATWGLHPEDIPADPTKVGAAIFIPTSYDCKIKKLDDQYILVSDERQEIAYEITTASEREAEYTSMDDFIELLETLIEGE